MRFAQLVASSTVTISLFCATLANAAPPASCVQRFVGEWIHSAGTTTVSANGKAYPHCSFGCVAVQTWTCNGNTFIFSNGDTSPGEFTGTMIDADHIQGSTWTSTRVGGSRTAATPPRPCSNFRLPGALSLLSPQTAKADDQDWQDKLKEMKFSPSAMSYVQRAKRKALHAFNTCAAVGERYCYPACKRELEACEQKAERAGMSAQACNAYVDQVCRPGCVEELAACQSGKPEPE